MNAHIRKPSFVLKAAALLAAAAFACPTLAMETVQGGAAHSQVYQEWWGGKKTKRTAVANDQSIWVDKNETIRVYLLASYGDSTMLHGARHELRLQVFENGKQLGPTAIYGGYTGGWETGSWWSQPYTSFSLSTSGWHFLDVKIVAKTDGSTKTRWGTIAVRVL
ncbi:MAG: hypothetical protein JSV91_04090 [Phycisphaerales bacterium]|nr:MAG: hypothetical protein JSV91_04090 [Phycisphaerales bacterium]